MSSKRTILSERELKLLEKLIVRHGSIVTFDQVFGELSINRQAARNLVDKLVRNGWLVRIKRGTYAIASLESHSFTNISPLVIARAMVPDCYVSFEFALNYHGFFDQLPSRLTAVTCTATKTYTFQGLDYRFVHAKPQMMTGYLEVSLEDGTARIAEAETALIDFLHFRRDAYTVDLVLEKLRETKEEISADKLARFAQPYPVVLKRRLGFLLDSTGIESSELHAQIKGLGGFTRLTPDSKKFNAEWRVYA